MIRLYEAIQVDKGFMRGIILDDSEATLVMQKNPNYRLGGVIASALTPTKLKPFIEKFKETAATPQFPGARLAILAANRAGILKYV